MICKPMSLNMRWFEWSAQTILSAHSFLTRRRAYDLALLVTLNIMVYRGWFMPGVIMDAEWTYILSKRWMLDYLSLPYAWSSFNGGFFSIGYGAFFTSLNTYPIVLIQAFMVALLGVDFSVTGRILWFYPLLFLSLFSMYYLTYTIFGKRSICFFSSMLYTFNMYILLEAVMGHIPALMSYALCPLVFALFIRGLAEYDARKSALAGIVFAISTFYDVRSSILVFLLISSYFLFNFLIKILYVLRQSTKIDESILKTIKIFLSMITVTVILDAFWILPMILTRCPSPPSAYTQPFWVEVLSTTKITEAIMFLFHPFWLFEAWPSDGKYSIALFMIPFSIFLAVLRFRKNLDVLFLSFVFLSAIFLVKGSNSPLGDIYLWFFRYIPFFNAFREPMKFFQLQLVASAPLFGAGIDILASMPNKIRTPIIMVDQKIKRAIVLSTLASILLFSVWPAVTYTYVFPGTFRTHPIPNEFEELSEWIAQKPDSFRIWFFPGTPGYAVTDQTHEAVSSSSFGYFGTFLWNTFYNNGTMYLGKITGLANAKYIVVSPAPIPPYFPSEEQHLQLLANQRGLTKLDVPNLHIFENSFAVPRFYATSHSAFVVGGRAALFSPSLLQHLDFSSWTLFFIDQLKSQGLDIWNEVDAIIFYEKDIDDLVLALTDETYRIDLSRSAKLKGRGSEGSFTKSIDSYLETQVGEIAESEGGLIEAGPQAKLDIVRTIENSGPYDIWIRLAFGPDRGVLTLLIDGKELFDVQPTSKSYEGLRWIKLGTFYLDRGSHTIGLFNYEGSNSLDELVIIPHNTLNSFKDQVLAMLSNKRLIFLNEAETRLYAEEGTWTKSNKFGPNASAGYVISSDSSSASTRSEIMIPLESEYNVAVRLSDHEYSGNLTIKIDDNLIYHARVPEIFRKQLTWLDIGPVFLKTGHHQITFSKRGGGTLNLDSLIIYNTRQCRENSGVDKLFATNDKIQMSYKRINPTNFEVQVNTDRSVFLVFSESYDSLWEVTVNGEKANSIIAYSIINSFLVHTMGNITLTVSFIPQTYVDIGFCISVVGGSLIVLFLLISNSPVRNWLRKNRNSLRHLRFNMRSREDHQEILRAAV